MVHSKKNIASLIVSLLMGTLFSQACVNRPLTVESHFNRGVELYDQGHYAEAIEEYKLALRKDPADTFSKYNLAVVYQDQGKLEPAVRLYREILEQTEDTNSRINLAAIHHAQGENDEAYRQLKTAAQNNADNPNPLSVLGHYLEQEGQVEEARKLYQKALEIDDKHGLSHFRLGRLYCGLENSARCEDHLKQAVEFSPEEPVWLEALANHHEKTGNALEAIHHLEKVSVLEPQRKDIFVRLGDLYKQERYYKEAIDRYWSANAIDGNDSHIHRNLLEIFQTLSLMEEARLETLEQESSVAKTP